MENKILQVFYGTDCLPYKDKERVVHFPIVGNAFQGASNTTKIRFYYDKIGDNDTTWIALAKLPNGKIGSKVLNKSFDYQVGEHYAELQLENFYTQVKGDLFISLNGYAGGVEMEFDPSTGLYVIEGTPTIQATGSIKLAINYATQYLGDGINETITLQQLMAEIGTKLGKGSEKYAKVIDEDDLNDQSLADYINVGDIVFGRNTKKFYIVDTDEETELYTLVEIKLGYDGDLGYFKVYQSVAEYESDLPNLPVGQVSAYIVSGQIVFVRKKPDGTFLNDMPVSKAITALYNGDGDDLVNDVVFNKGREKQVIDGTLYKNSEQVGNEYATIADATAEALNAVADYEEEHPIGQANGIASLDGNGKVPSSQLPSYVDDVLEFNSLSDFPATGESGKIYVAKDTNKTYRWSGTQYVEISESLALGETSSTAYAGNKGKANRDDINKINAVVDFDDIATPTATNGTITQDMLDTLQASNHALIHFNNQFYRLQDMNVDEGFMTYNNNEYISNENVSKTITITISTLAWVLNEVGGSGGGAVDSVNGKVGVVVLTANDINANNSTTIQANLERIDGEINRVEDVANGAVEIANGKASSFSIDTTLVSLTEEDFGEESSSTFFKDLAGTQQISTWQDFLDYIAGDSENTGTCVNSLFDSEENDIASDLLSDITNYILIRNSEIGTNNFVVIKNHSGDYFEASDYRIKNGDVFFVEKQGVPDRWVSVNHFRIWNKVLAFDADKPALTNYGKLDGNNTWTGTNTFSNGITTGNNQIIKNDSDGQLSFWQGLNRYLKIAPSGIQFSTKVLAASNNAIDIGREGVYFREGFIKKITDANGSYSSENTFNVINATDIADTDILTNEQYDLITNGKPTFIKGIWKGFNGAILSPCGYIDSVDTWSALIHGTRYNYYGAIGILRIPANTKKLTLPSATQNAIDLSNISSFNSKQIPAYPSSPSTSKVLTYGTDNNLSWGDTAPTLKDLTLTSSGQVYTSNETSTKHLHLMFEIETGGLHYGADCDLHPYNGANCLVTIPMLIGGSIAYANAYVGSDNKINFEIPSGVTATNVVAHYYEYN